MPRLIEVLPQVGEAVVRELEKRGEADLAATVPGLEIVDRCRCGSDFCAQVHTAPEPKGTYGPNLRNLHIDGPEGMIILDIVEGRIMSVEVLFWPGAREAVARVMP